MCPPNYFRVCLTRGRNAELPLSPLIELAQITVLAPIATAVTTLTLTLRARLHLAAVGTLKMVHMVFSCWCFVRLTTCQVWIYFQTRLDSGRFLKAKVPVETIESVSGQFCQSARHFFVCSTSEPHNQDLCLLKCTGGSFPMWSRGIMLHGSGQLTGLVT